MMRLHDKSAIVTGAGRGIGAAIARTFAAEGAGVLVADVDPHTAQATADAIQEAGGGAFPVQVDVAVGSSVRNMVEAALARFGAIDILVNNAGILLLGSTKLDAILGVTEDGWDRMIDVNLKGVFLCCQAILPPMLARGRGAILNMASSAARIGGTRGWVSYPASKGGVVGLTIDLARKLAPHGIRVNGIAPGYIETELTSGYSPEDQARFGQGCPMGRGGSPQEVANAALFLCSDESSYVTGQVLSVDGGQVTY